METPKKEDDGPSLFQKGDMKLEHMNTSARIRAAVSHADQSSMDEMLDRALKKGTSTKFIAQYKPASSWLWRQWTGTVLQQTWQPAVVQMLVSLLLCFVMEVARKEGEHTWTLFEVPNMDDRWVARMKGFTTMWGYLLTMATFVNSFFLSQAYGFWLATKGNVRKVQGRLNDLCMLAATHAQRDVSTGTFTPESRELLDDISRWARLYHILFWATRVRPARSDEGVSFCVLRTELGIKGLLSRGALTQREYELLQSPRLNETNRHWAVLEWLVARLADARQCGLLGGSYGLEARYLEEACKLRSTCASIADDAAARMPLSYVHLVQLLVDTLVVLAPFALYPKLGVLTALLSGILVIFYRGFLQLSKSFLDPFGNEDSVSENFSISCLIAESNAGSVRWSDALQELPFTPKGQQAGASA